MILTTTPTLENYTITDYLGIVSGVYEGYVHSGNLGDIITLTTHESYGAITSQKGKNGALELLEGEAKSLRADAVVGIQFQFTVYSGKSFVIIATGTAVRIKEKKTEEAAGGVTETQKEVPVERIAFSDPEIDRFMMEMESLDGAIQINSRVQEFGKGRFSDELLKKLEDCAYMERMYGNKKQKAIKLLQDYFSQNGDD